MLPRRPHLLTRTAFPGQDQAVSKKQQDVEGSVRMFNCVRCHALVSICRSCDRGNRYCSKSCSDWARRRSLREAGARYQRTEKGATQAAQRQAAYRQRRKESVTHQPAQASTSEPGTESRAEVGRGRWDANESRPKVGCTLGECSMCRCTCSPLVRRSSLRELSRRQKWRERRSRRVQWDAG